MHERWFGSFLVRATRRSIRVAQFDIEKGRERWAWIAISRRPLGFRTNYIEQPDSAASREEGRDA